MVTLSVVLRSTLVMVTVAPGMAAPVESLTVPAMLPYTAWAAAGAGQAAAARTASRVRMRAGLQKERRALRRAELIQPPCCVVPRARKVLEDEKRQGGPDRIRDTR